MSGTIVFAGYDWYIFDDNFKDFGIIFDSDAKDAEKKREEFGNIIRIFAATSRRLAEIIGEHY